MPRVPSASASARRGAAVLAPPERRSSRLASSLAAPSKPSGSAPRAAASVKREAGVRVKEEPGSADAGPSTLQVNVAEAYVKAEPGQRAEDAYDAAAAAAAAHAALPTGEAFALLLDDPNSPALRAAVARLKASAKRSEEQHGLPPLLPAAEVRLRTHIQRPALPYDFDAARAHLERVDPRFRILFHQGDFRKYLSNGNEGPDTLNLFKCVCA